PCLPAISAPSRNRIRWSNRTRGERGFGGFIGIEFALVRLFRVLSAGALLVGHQLMALEASQLFGWPLAGITRRPGQHPAEIQKLTRFRQAIDEIPRLGVEVLPVERHLMPLAASLSQLHGLLTNDAITLATMQDQSIIHIASHDADFDRVPGLTRYAPV